MLSDWMWQKRMQELKREFPELSDQQILALLRKEFGFRLLRNLVKNNQDRKKTSALNKLSRVLGRRKRDRITLMYLDSLLRNLRDRNLRSLFARFRPKTKGDQVTKTRVITRTVERVVREKQPLKYLQFVLEDLRKKKMKEAFNDIQVTNLFKKLKGQPGNLYTIEHIQQVKRDMSDGSKLHVKLMLILLDKIVGYNQRKSTRQAMDSIKDLDYEKRKVLFGKVTRVKDNKSVSGKHHPLYK